MTTPTTSSPRIVVFGATGYTGRLTAAALVALGHKPLLAGRNADKLAALARDLGGELPTQVASSDDPASVRALLRADDVLISTVGPFFVHGTTAIEAAIAQRAHYIDSTGEPAFIRQVFQTHAAAAERAGVLLLTACGYDYVPGHLAAGVALQAAGSSAIRADVGYYVLGKLDRGFSQGTLVSSKLAAMHPGMEWHDGRLVELFGAMKVREFEVEGKSRAGISLGGSEHYALPESYPQLRDINVYLGWYGRRSYMMSRGARALALLRKLPVLGELPVWLSSFGAESQGQGPDAATRAQSRSHVVGAAYDASGRELARADVTGGNAYDFTAKILAWAAIQTLQGKLRQRGARGPIAAFGLDALTEGCAQAGLDAQLR